MKGILHTPRRHTGLQNLLGEPLVSAFMTHIVCWMVYTIVMASIAFWVAASDVMQDSGPYIVQHNA